MKIWFENRKYYMHLRMIRWLKSIRKIVGKFNALFINNRYARGMVKVRRWQLKLFKCVTADDIYILTGIYDKLIKPKRCEGYNNFAIHDKTFHDIGTILCDNYRWNEETMHTWNKNAIRFTWMNYSPISLDGMDEWEIFWCENDALKVVNDGRP